MKSIKDSGAVLILLIFVIYSLLKVINALRKGYISYSGNRIQFKSQTYTRKDQPFLFWAGVFAFSLPTALLVIGLLFGLFEN